MSEENTTTSKNRNWLKITGITIAIVVVLGGLGYGGFYFITHSGNLEPAPDFSVTTLAGANFTLTDYRGKVVLLDFMSVTCPPCMQLMPELVSISEEFNDSLVILSIDVDPTDSETQLLEFKNDYNATWSFALDSDDLFEKFSVLDIPKTVIIDAKGYITLAETGFTAGSGLTEKIEETLAGTAEPIVSGIEFSMLTAVFAGVLSFFSPCAFPLLPGYMAYNLDLLMRDERREQEDKNEKKSKEEKKTALKRRIWKSFIWGSAAAFGIVLFYMIIGIIVASVSEGVGEGLDRLANAAEYISLSIGILLIILGIISLTPLSLDMSKAITAVNNLATRRKRRKEAKKLEEQTDDVAEGEDVTTDNHQDKVASESPQIIQLFLYGVTYALASIGCNLPILLAMSFSAIESGAFAKAILIFAIYSLAMGLPMIIITILVGLSKDALINKLQASTRFVKILSGTLLILAGGFLIGYFFWNHFSTG
ncbi:MAG: redoxin domain-containing protein [Candidatus Heimdallarchaeota archaeon]